MEIYILLFGICFGTGVFFLSAQLMRLPTIASQKALINMGNRSVKKASSFDVIVVNLTTKLSEVLTLNEFAEMRLQGTLRAAGINQTPSFYTANAIVKGGLIAVGGLPCLLILLLTENETHKQVLFLIDEISIDIEAKLACLGIVAKVYCENFTEEKELALIEKLYNDYLVEVNIFSLFDSKYLPYLLDYISFCLCLERGKISQIQKIANLIINKLNSIEDITQKIRFYSLGNLIYYNNFHKATELTEKAYYISKDHPYRNLIAYINYSVSLITCGEFAPYKNLSLPIKFNEIKEGLVRMTLINNQLVYDVYNSNDKTILKHFEQMKDVFNNYSNITTSDVFILKNNYLALLILCNKDVVGFADELINQTCDEYHNFFTYHNLLVYYTLQNNIYKFQQVLENIKIPLLLEPYQPLFQAKFNFLKSAISTQVSLNQLKNELECELNSLGYDHPKFYLYKKAILLGLVERWFE